MHFDLELGTVLRLQGSITFHLGLQVSLWSNIQVFRYRNHQGSGLHSKNFGASGTPRLGLSLISSWCNSLQRQAFVRHLLEP